MVGIIHCTPHCNLACRYCFEENWKHSNFDSDEINNKFRNAMDMFIQFAVDLSNGYPNEKIDIILHGGEPLLVDIEIIEEYFDWVSSVCDNIRFIVQSNGIIITEKHIEVFKKYNVYVGFSLDGYKEVHDCFRVDKNGNGTHKKVLENYFRLKNEGIHIGILTTFNSKNVENIEKVYHFFSENNIDFAFNPFFEPSSSDYSVIAFDYHKYIKAMCKLFDLWIEDESSEISIRNFESIMDGLTNKEKSTHICSGVINCSEEFVAIDLEGNLYTCNHFCGNKDNAYAHFDNRNICDVILSDNPFKNRWEILKKGKCGNCDVSDLCHGGCPYHALMSNDDYNTPDNFCEYNKVLIHHIYNYLKENLVKEC